MRIAEYNNNNNILVRIFFVPFEAATHEELVLLSLSLSFSSCVFLLGKKKSLPSTFYPLLLIRPLHIITAAINDYFIIN